MKTIYLAGPITGCDYEGATDWRNKFARLININPFIDIKCLDPMRGKEWLKDVTEFLGSSYDLPIGTPKGIITRDFNDVKICDLLVVNFLGAKIASIGTCFEIAWCYQSRTPIIIIMEEINVHRHSFITEAAGFIVETLDEAAVLARSVLAV